MVSTATDTPLSPTKLHPPQQHAPPPPNAPQGRKNREGPETGHSESMPGLPTPALTCAHWGVHLQDNFPDRSSNNHNDSFPFVLSSSSFCALHRFRRARSALSCYLPLLVPFPMHLVNGTGNSPSPGQSTLE